MPNLVLGAIESSVWFVTLVSIFAVEIAMLAAFGTAEDSQLRFVMPILTGTAIAICIGILGVRSVLGLDGKR